MYSLKKKPDFVYKKRVCGILKNNLMKFKNIIHLIFFFLVESSFLGKKNFRKHFSSFSKNMKELIFKNGIIAGNFFLSPIKMFLYTETVLFFIKCILKKNFGKKNLKTRPNTPKEENIFSYQTIFLDSKQIGQLVFMEGIVTNMTPPLTKKIEKSNILFYKTLQAQKNCLKLNAISLKKASKQKILTDFPEIQADYQEARIFSFDREFQNKKNSDVFFSKICFTGKSTKICEIGDKISTWGIVKSHLSSGSNVFSGASVDLYLHVFLVKKKKKKEVKQISNKKQILQFIDSVFHWQDSKIRGASLFKINYTLLYLFPGKKFSSFFKLLILVSFIGGLSKKIFANFTQAGNFCLIGDLESENTYILKEIKKFWRNSWFFSLKFLESPDLLNFQFESSLDKKIHFGLISRFLSEAGVLFLDNIGDLENGKTNFINKKVEKVLKKFLERDGFNSPFPRHIFFASTKFKEEPGKPGGKVYHSRLKARNDCLFQRTKKIQFKKYFDILFFLSKKKKSSKNKKKYTNSPLFINGHSRNKTIKFFLSLKNGFREWSSCNFRKYFIFAKSFLKPKFSQEAESFLLVWYRKESSKKTFEGKEISFLEKLIRLSEAHARLLFQDFVLVGDCIFAFFIVYYSFISSEFFKLTNVYFDLLQMNLNVFSSFRYFRSFFFFKKFKTLEGIKGLAGGTLKI